jgi:hypothetical protein
VCCVVVWLGGLAVGLGIRVLLGLGGCLVEFSSPNSQIDRNPNKDTASTWFVCACILSSFFLCFVVVYHNLKTITPQHIVCRAGPLDAAAACCSSRQTAQVAPSEAAG